MAGRGRANGVTDEQIVDVYRDLKSGEAVARKLGVCAPTVYKALRDNGIPTDRKSRKVAMSGVTDEQIINLYHQEKHASRVMTMLGISYKRFSTTLREHGVQRYGHTFSRLERRILTAEQEAEVLRAFVDDEEPAIDIARRLGVTAHAVRSVLQRAGVQAFRKSHLSKAERQRAFELYSQGLDMREIGKRLGRSEGTVRRFLHLDHPETVRPRIRRGSANPLWKGGRSIDKQGYVNVRIDQSDPIAVAMGQRNGVVMEHRLVMARHLGRPLTSHEYVHHIDGDKQNNRIENLQLRNGRHGKGVVSCCLDCGSLNIGTKALD